jgi:hypothetical protein
VERALALPEGPFESGIYFPLDQVEIAASDAASGVLNGNLALSWVGSTFEGTLDDEQQPERASAHLALRGALTLELALSAGADLACSLRLVTVPLPSFDILGVTVSPFLQVGVHLTGSADADAVLSLVLPFDLGSGFSFDGSPRAGMTSSPHCVPEVGLPDAPVALAGSADLEVALAFMLSVQGVSVGGPALQVTLGAQVDVDPLSGVDAEGTATIEGGWAFPGPDLMPDIPEDLAALHPPARFAIPLSSDPFGADLPPTRWSRLFDVDSDDGTAAVLPAGDGVVVIEDRGRPWLATLDGAGVPLWQNTAVITDPWTPTCLATAADGDILAAGLDGAAPALRVERFSAAGEPRWKRTISVPGADQTKGLAIVGRSSGGAVIAGQVNRSSRLTPLLLAVDDDGEVEWAVEVDGGSGSSNPTLTALAQTPEGDLIAVGEVDYTALETVDPLTPINGRNAFIVRLRPDGTLVSGYALGAIGDEKATAVTIAPDGSCLLGGHRGIAPNAWLALLAVDDSLRWSATYRSRPHLTGVDFTELKGISSLENGFLACGQMEPPGVDAWALRVDQEGMPVWSKSYVSAAETSTDDELSDVVALPTGLVFCGRNDLKEENSSHGDIWVTRTNVDGMVHFAADSGLDCQNTAATWQRVTDHSVHPLAPTAVDVPVEVDPDTVLQVDPAIAFGELISD